MGGFAGGFAGGVGVGGANVGGGFGFGGVGSGFGGAGVGVGSGFGGAGVGSVAVASAAVGVGGDGDPGPEPQGCDADEEDAWINCKGLNTAECMEKCAEAGATCAPQMKHPQNVAAGWGNLYMCKNGSPTHVCSYYYSNGDECIYFYPIGRLPWCVYVGQKP
jgi:hypothetical protein